MSGAGAPASFEAWLDQAPFGFGQIWVDDNAGGGFILCHRDDAGRDDLAVYAEPEAAAKLVRYDDAGAYRSLKTAPNLRHGWRLELASRAELRRALDLFYPARVAAYEHFVTKTLTTTALRQTLARQSGMYRVAARLSDEQADVLVANFCRSDGGCLRTILWKRDDAGTTPSSLLPPQKFDPHHDQTGRGERAVPLLCQEPCNLLVAAAREVVKGGR